MWVVGEAKVYVFFNIRYYWLCLTGVVALIAFNVNLYLIRRIHFYHLLLAYLKSPFFIRNVLLILSCWEQCITPLHPPQTSSALSQESGRSCGLHGPRGTLEEHIVSRNLLWFSMSSPVRWTLSQPLWITSVFSAARDFTASTRPLLSACLVGQLFGMYRCVMRIPSPLCHFLERFRTTAAVHSRKGMPSCAQRLSLSFDY